MNKNCQCPKARCGRYGNCASCGCRLYCHKVGCW